LGVYFWIVGLWLHWAFCNIGRFVIGRFVELGVLMHWAFCCVWRFVFGRFVIGRFVPTPKKIPTFFFGASRINF